MVDTAASHLAELNDSHVVEVMLLQLNEVQNCISKRTIIVTNHVFTRTDYYCTFTLLRKWFKLWYLYHFWCFLLFNC